MERVERLVVMAKSGLKRISSVRIYVQMAKSIRLTNAYLFARRISTGLTESVRKYAQILSTSKIEDVLKSVFLELSKKEINAFKNASLATS